MRLPQPGEMFRGKYKLQEVLGRGGFAIVYRATDVEVGRDVAIKVLTPGEDGYPQHVVSRFMREARVIAGLQDPHTITMFDFGRDDGGLLYMVFEFVQGRDLSEVLAEQGALPAAAVSHILTQLLHSLREAHHLGVLHRDVKPANVLVYEYLGDRFRAKLLDFGIAKHALTPSDAGPAITREGAMVGTPRYMSPEQILGEPLTAASDIYSLGLVAHEMLTGEPAAGGPAERVVRAHVMGPAIALPDSLAVDDRLREIVDRMTARDPVQRFASAQAVLDVLSASTGELSRERRALPAVEAAPAPASPRPATLLEEAPDGLDAAVDVSLPVPAGSREVGPFWMVGVGLVIGVGAVVGALAFSRSDEPAPPAPTLSFDQPGLAAGVVEREDSADEDGEASHATLPSDAGTVADVGQDAADETGCGRPPPFRGADIMSVTRLLSREQWFVYVPDPYDENHAHTVILMFHDDWQDPTQFFDQSGLLKIADEEHAVVIGPPGGRYNAYDPGFPVERGRKILDETSKRLCLNLDKVVAFGNGAGARVVDQLACEFPLRAAATFSRSPTRKQKICHPDPAIPFIHFAGLRDGFNPAEGGKGCSNVSRLSLSEKTEAWRKRNACSAQAKSFARGKCRRWRCEDAPFAMCELDSGHVFRVDAPLVSGCMGEPADFPISRTAWDFFESTIDL